jgi:hypothetical protein
MDVEAFRAARVLPHSASRRSMDAEAFRAACRKPRYSIFRTELHMLKHLHTK